MLYPRPGRKTNWTVWKASYRYQTEERWNRALSIRGKSGYSRPGVDLLACSWRGKLEMGNGHRRCKSVIGCVLLIRARLAGETPVTHGSILPIFIILPHIYTSSRKIPPPWLISNLICSPQHSRPDDFLSKAVHDDSFCIWYRLTWQSSSMRFRYPKPSNISWWWELRYPKSIFLIESCTFLTRITF